MFNITEASARRMKDALDIIQGVAPDAEKYNAVGKALWDLWEGDKYHVDIGHRSINLSLTGTKEDLQKLWGELRKLGWEPNKRVPNEQIASFSNSWSNGNASIYLYFYSSVCERVKVGTQMVEQDVYEVRCGDAT